MTIGEIILHRVSGEIARKIEKFDFINLEEEFLEIFTKLTTNHEVYHIRLMIYILNGNIQIAYLMDRNVSNINTEKTLKRLDHHDMWKNYILENVIRSNPLSLEKVACELTTTYKIKCIVNELGEHVSLEKCERTPC